MIKKKFSAILNISQLKMVILENCLFSIENYKQTEKRKWA